MFGIIGSLLSWILGKLFENKKQKELENRNVQLEKENIELEAENLGQKIKAKQKDVKEKRKKEWEKADDDKKDSIITNRFRKR